MLLLTLILSIISGTCYRMGGSAKFNTKYRDLGCPLIALILLWLLGGLGLQSPILPKIALILTSYGLMFGSLTTYWDFITGKDNFYLHGLFCGLAFIPLHWTGLSWWVIGIRAIVCAIGMGLWSAWQGNDIKEEFGRGFILTVTIPLLLI